MSVGDLLERSRTFVGVAAITLAPSIATPQEINTAIAKESSIVTFANSIYKGVESGLFRLLESKEVSRQIGVQGIKPDIIDTIAYGPNGCRIVIHRFNYNIEVDWKDSNGSFFKETKNDYMPKSLRLLDGGELFSFEYDRANSYYIAKGKTQTTPAHFFSLLNNCMQPKGQTPKPAPTKTGVTSASYTILQPSRL